MAQGTRTRARRQESGDEQPAQRAPAKQRFAVRKVGRGRYGYRGKMFEPGKVYMVPQEVHDHLTGIADQYGRPRYFVSVPIGEDGQPIQRQATRRGATIHRRRRGPGVGSQIVNQRAAAATEAGNPKGAQSYLEPDEGEPGVPV